MSRKRIFTIPIFSCTEDEYWQLVKLHKNKCRLHYSQYRENIDECEFEKYYQRLYGGQARYNNFRMGFLYVVFNDYDLEIDMEISANPRKYGANMVLKNKYVTHDEFTYNGIHENLEFLDNQGIANKIKEIVTEISTNKWYKRLYFDLSQFNIIINHLDYLSILKS